MLQDAYLRLITVTVVAFLASVAALDSIRLASVDGWGAVLIITIYQSASLLPCLILDALFLRPAFWGRIPFVSLFSLELLLAFVTTLLVRCGGLGAASIDVLYVIVLRSAASATAVILPYVVFTILLDWWLGSKKSDV